ncbi:MAG: hypothetical protein ACREDT_12120 [Methylocella sp.]
MSIRYQDRNESRLSLHREAKRVFPRGCILKAAVAGFAACAMALPAMALPPPTIVGGTVVATITVTFKVAPASGSTVVCGLSLISSDQRSPSDTKSKTGTVSGSAATCVVRVHYSWPLTTPASDTMTIAYSVQGPVQTSSGITNIISMPANGAVTTEAIGVTQ